MTQGEGQDFGEVPERLHPVALYVWLTVAGGSLGSVLDGRTHPVWAAGAGLAAFVALYAAALWLRLKTGRLTASLILLAALGVVTIALNSAFGTSMAPLFILLAIACGAIVPWRELRKGPPLTVVLMWGLASVAALILWAHHASAGEIWQVWYSSVLAGFVVALVTRFMQAIAELRRTRQELADAAVDAERVRFARDMHDLLGHTLSVMVVKAQVVRRLATRDPQAAAVQAADIEAVGRRALTEVRQAVTGYRGQGLARELKAARTALADAGYAVHVRQDGDPVPARASALLGWVVREGTTNVIKHSGGQHCEIAIHHEQGKATVEITDDGGGNPATGLPSGGHGLGGLRERVDTGGGTLEAASRPGGGFRLAATVPVAAESEVSA
ncbi:MAG TPA: sensor histidine kinase [Streptosporangiaceae bacterium]|nr:sensor histidine kinase [Streptosporangiaceae bacterium]